MASSESVDGDDGPTINDELRATGQIPDDKDDMGDAAHLLFGRSAAPTNRDDAAASAAATSDTASLALSTTTVVPPMLYTFGSVPKYAIPDNGMQIFYVKVAQIKEEEGLHWPLHVYGLIATRDSIDPRRNLIFHRTRDNCQTVTEEVPFLQLTGPSRAVVLVDPVRFEVQLKSKGRTESEDKVICFDILNSQLASGYVGYCRPRIFTSHLRCNQSKLEFAFAVLARSVEATIRVEIVDGAWPEHLGGRVTTRTASIHHEGIVPADSGGGRMPVSGSGVIELTRRVVCVELSGELEVDVVAFRVVDNIYSDAAKDSVVFTPKRAAISYDT
ncbi:unnamed protein product [Miscanthus lutarioriparius]|uniref:DUF6598 domain-containing protein n=1 Tax=Miscanthus lutarioriparius TaxID=422564 RepID=A0A811NS91_9POAL|nr:unnamed protein product [Miscanthus lutarioriparius]